MTNSWSMLYDEILKMNAEENMNTVFVGAYGEDHITLNVKMPDEFIEPTGNIDIISVSYTHLTLPTIYSV